MSLQVLSEAWKVHRRDIRLDGFRHRILSLRPRDHVRFATNHFHDTWHIISDMRGGRLIGRLCWAMAYQKKPGTLLLIDRPHMVPTPFEADPSSPIVIINSDLGRPSRQAIRHLKANLPLATPSEGTVKLSTFGLDHGEMASRLEDRWGWVNERRATIDCIHGVVVLAAPGDVLKFWGRRLSQIGRGMRYGTDYEYLAGSDGEVQIFRAFRLMVRLSAEERDGQFPGRAHERLQPFESDRIYERRASREAVLRAEWQRRRG